MKVRFFSLIVLISMGALFAFATAMAQDNGGLPEDYNWCSDPNYWGDGRCNNTEDEDLRTCLWEMGWYLPRVEAGLFTMEQVIAASSCVQCVNQTIVLAGSPYDGWYDIFINGDHLDANHFKTDTICGFTIYGNDHSNTIIGSSGNDTIFGYGSNDNLYGDTYGNGGNGNDRIDGGTGSDVIVGDSDTGGTGTDTCVNGELVLGCP
ncbi:MAG: hypothetical protein D6712_09225 [Chloroflexi bacterium]|nr:MAG: hypothetical protein D6712_09225 [Chloroflexota bacterium]